MKNKIVVLSSGGNTKKTRSFLTRMKSAWYMRILRRYGEYGVQVLSDATPVDTGVTAASWSYTITDVPGGISLAWTNSSAADGIPIVILIQYGHGMPNGGYVQPYDFINPAMREIFDKMASELWEEVVAK